MKIFYRDNKLYTLKELDIDVDRQIAILEKEITEKKDSLNELKSYKNAKEHTRKSKLQSEDAGNTN